MRKLDELTRRLVEAVDPDFLVYTAGVNRGDIHAWSIAIKNRREDQVDFRSGHFSAIEFPGAWPPHICAVWEALGFAVGQEGKMIVLVEDSWLREFLEGRGTIHVPENVQAIAQDAKLLFMHCRDRVQLFPISRSSNDRVRKAALDACDNSDSGFPDIPNRSNTPLSVWLLPELNYGSQ